MNTIKKKKKKKGECGSAIFFLGLPSPSLLPEYVLYYCTVENDREKGGERE
jgi:hypothetical protein